MTTLQLATPLIEERVVIPAPGDPLRATLTYDEEGPASWKVLLCAPHPLLGGTPDNPVLLRLARTFAASGAAVLAWEYRLPDAAANPERLAATRAAFWRDHRIDPARSPDLRDATTACRWLADLDLAGEGPFAQHLPLAVAGYSYGGALAMLLSSSARPAFVVSPPLRALPATWRPAGAVCAIAATDDVAVSHDDWARAERRWGRVIRSRTTVAGDHFYRGCLDAIDAEVRAFACSFVLGELT